MINNGCLVKFTKEEKEEGVFYYFEMNNFHYVVSFEKMNLNDYRRKEGYEDIERDLFGYENKFETIEKGYERTEIGSFKVVNNICNIGKNFINEYKPEYIFGYALPEESHGTIRKTSIRNYLVKRILSDEINYDIEYCELDDIGYKLFIYKKYLEDSLKPWL